MGTLPLKPAEDRLVKDVEHGDDTIFTGDRETISAEVLRHIVLSLPLFKEGIWPFVHDRVCATTGAGVSIRNALIDGRVELDAAIGCDGGPLCPLEFRDCLFDGGFSGANSHFSRLGFRACTFTATGVERDKPSVDLSGAAVDGDLDLRKVRPHGEDDLLWIRAPGIRVDGDVDLSRCRLHAPPPVVGRRMGDEARDALNLALAKIRGDLRFLNGSRSRGRIKLRAAHVDGDVWMSGATVESVGEEPVLFFQGAKIGGFLMLDGCFDLAGGHGQFRKFRCAGGLSLRAAEIERDLYLRHAVVQGALDAGGLQVKEDFIVGAEIRGAIDLSGCRIGGSLDVSRMDLACSVKSVSLTDGTIGRSLTLAHPGARTRLLKARRGPLASLPGVDLLETLWALFPEKAFWNWREEKESEHRLLVQAAFLVRGAQIFHLDGHAETLDRAVDTFGRDLNAATAIEFARLCSAYVIGENGVSRLVGRPPHIELERENHWTEIAKTAPSFFAPSAVHGRIGRATGKRGPDDPKPGREQVAGAGPCFVFRAAAIHEDWLRRRTFILDARTNRVLSRPVANSPEFALRAANRFTNGLIVPPLLPKKMRPVLESEDWLSAPAVEGLPPYDCPPRLEDRIRPYVQPRPVLQAVFDLEGLTCDMLDDHAGRAWGAHFDKIRMNHFVYHRTSWEPGEPENRKALSVRPIKGLGYRMAAVNRAIWPASFGDFRQAVRGAVRRASAALGNSVNRLVAQRIPVAISWLFNLSERLRIGDRSTTIEKKRNWLYRQFDTAGLSSSSKYQVRSSDYRSQPFEQAIRVARAEGREDYAIYFEILKERIEWSIFISRNIFWFVLVGLVAASVWYALARAIDPGLKIMVAALILFGVSLLPSAANWVMRWGFGYLRRPSRAVSTLIIAFLVGWAGVLAANQRGMLVIDVAPVAGVVGGDERIRMGSAPGDRVLRNVHCGDAINEGLYALDILIPLIDLRQESRCEVEAAEIFNADDLAQVRLLRTRRLQSATEREETLWKVMKALYAIAGWLIVSLSILTFAHINRAPTEPMDGK